MDLKLALGLYTAFFMIWSSHAESESENEPKQLYKNFYGSIIDSRHPKHPNKLCYTALNRSASTYWVTSESHKICSDYIRCRNPPNEDLILYVKPENGVVCDSHGQSVCIDGGCEYLIVEYDEEKAGSVQRFKDYDGPVIDYKSRKHPNEICRQYYNDGEASWKNKDSENCCRSSIFCYKPKDEHVDRFNRNPENGVVIDERTICWNGDRKEVEPHVTNAADERKKSHGTLGHPKH